MIRELGLGLLLAYSPQVHSTGKDDDWVDYTDMLRYDSVSQSMRGGDDPCAKCYKKYGLWAPIVVLKHAPVGDLLKIGLTLLVIILGHVCIRALRQWGNQRASPPVAVPQAQAALEMVVGDDRVAVDAATQTEQGMEQRQAVSQQEIPREPEEIPQRRQRREESEDSSDRPESLSNTEGHVMRAQTGPAARRASLDKERPNFNRQLQAQEAHDTVPCRGEGDGGTDSDSERYCSSHFPVPETTEQQQQQTQDEGTFASTKTHTDPSTVPPQTKLS
ncbi:hypothetical protein AALO_G00016050 [Alosa alosa]|uniref:Uncharacterized protein n=1 Tax=Alosa alosa TaxID=278164 RepID=A0AAV6HH76_9TELE|nr:uncharacterized protein LOC125304014 [Alosa alosa]KAG5286543.1 hypothetical protein AALO_G00016050 [Alosa alosa]